MTSARVPSPLVVVARVLGVASGQKLAAAGGQRLLPLLLQCAAAGQLHGPAGGILQQIHDSAQHINRGGILEFALIRRLHQQRLVKLRNEAGDVGIVRRRGHHQDLIQPSVRHHLRRGLRHLRVLLHHLAIDENGLGRALLVIVLPLLPPFIAGAAADRIHSFGFLLLRLRRQRGLHDLRHGGGIRKTNRNEFRHQCGAGVSQVDGFTNADELFHHRGTFRDEQARWSEHRSDPAINTEPHMP
jgi:hypothetical protein